MARRDAAPKHLKGAARRLWVAVCAEHEIETDAAAREILLAACQALARAEEARERIAQDGAVMEDRFGQLKAHPACAIERDSLGLMVRSLKALDLEPEELTGRARASALAERAGVGRFAPGRPPALVRKAGS